MRIIQEAWRKRPHAYWTLDMDDWARNLALVSHVDACEEWKYVQLGPTPAPENEIARCGRDGWYCETAQEIKRLGEGR